MFAPDGEGVIRLPRFRLPPGGDRDRAEAWSFSIEPYAPPPPKPLVPEIPPDDMFAARLATLPVEAGACWETGAIFMQTPVVAGTVRCTR